MESTNRQIERTALDWLARQDGDTWSQADEAALESWRRESTANNVAFVRVQTIWRRADRLKVLGAGFDAEKLPAPQEFNLSPVFRPASGTPTFSLRDRAKTEVKAKERSRIFPAALAATLVLATATYLYFTRAPAYDTPVGGLSAVPMKDGSRVVLNTDSRIRVELTDEARTVRLERGEAYFEVAPDPKRPFIVDTGSQRITVLGTAFSVRLGASTEIVVTEGKVRLDGYRGGSEGEVREPLILAAGDTARVTQRNVSVQRQTSSELDQSLSWRSGLVVFSDVDLAHAVTELNRYNDRKIVIEDPSIAAMRFSGKLKPTYVEGFVRLLEENFLIQAHQDDERIVLKPRR